MSGSWVLGAFGRMRMGCSRPRTLEAERASVADAGSDAVVGFSAFQRAQLTAHRARSGCAGTAASTLGDGVRGDSDPQRVASPSIAHFFRFSLVRCCYTVGPYIDIPRHLSVPRGFSTRCPRVPLIGLAPSPSFHHLRPTEATSLLLPRRRPGWPRYTNHRCGEFLPIPIPTGCVFYSFLMRGTGTRRYTTILGTSVRRACRELVQVKTAAPATTAPR